MTETTTPTATTDSATTKAATTTTVPTKAVAPAAATVPPGGNPPKPAIGGIVRSAALRAARTFSQAFLAVLTAGPVLGLNANAFRAGATAGVAGVLTLVQRWLDTTRIPTIPIG